MPILRLLAAVPVMVMAAGALAQVPATNDIANCTLIADPTAQRLCIESARQSRPASTFDPTAQKQRLERRRPPGRDALSPPDKRAPTANGGVKLGTTPPGATPDAYRDTKWRLQIP